MSDFCKRTTWTPEEIESAVEHAIANHATYLDQKQHGKVMDFWWLIGQFVGHSGEECRRLFKHLSAEYRHLKKALSRPGADTTTAPTIRQSASLFVIFESYYRLFRNEVSAVPVILASEAPFNVVQSRTDLDVKRQGSSSQSSSPRATSAAHEAADVFEKLPLVDNSSELEKGPAFVFRNDSKKVVVKSTTMRPQLTNEEYMRQMLDIENRKLAIKNRRLQLKTKKLRLSRRKVEALEKICVETETLRTMYGMANEMEIVARPPPSVAQSLLVSSKLICSTSKASKQST